MNSQNGNNIDVIHAIAPTKINLKIFTNIFETLLKKTSLLPILFDGLFWPTSERANSNPQFVQNFFGLLISKPQFVQNITTNIQIHIILVS